MKKIYVGNLSYETTEDQLTELFGQHGAVKSVKIIRDKFDNSSKGFGFVEMDNGDEGESAISALDGADHNGRALRVNEARERRDDGGNRGGGGGGYRGGGGGGGHRGGGHRGGGHGGGGGNRY